MQSINMFIINQQRVVSERYVFYAYELLLLHFMVALLETFNVEASCLDVKIFGNSRRRKVVIVFSFAKSLP